MILKAKDQRTKFCQCIAKWYCFIHPTGEFVREGKLEKRKTICLGTLSDSVPEVSLTYMHVHDSPDQNSEKVNFRIKSLELQ